MDSQFTNSLRSARESNQPCDTIQRLSHGCLCKCEPQTGTDPTDAQLESVPNFALSAGPVFCQVYRTSGGSEKCPYDIGE